MAALRRTILVFSLEPWGDMWYSKHHYAAELAKTHHVYFISPPERWRLRDLFSFGVKSRSTPEGVTVLEYRNNLPLRALPPVLYKLVDRFSARKLSRFLGEGENILWCFHPTTLSNHEILRQPGTRMIYHVVDPYVTLANDFLATRNADLIVAINPWFLEHYRKLNPNTILVPHGIRARDREHAPERVAEYRKQWGNYAVMAAGINHRTNYDLLIALAMTRPSVKLVLIGPLITLPWDLGQLRDRLLTLPNVVHLGVQHPDELRNIIGGATVGLVTYKFEPTRSVPTQADGTPLKVLTYLSQLCPVVSTINSYVPQLADCGMFKAEDEGEFIRTVSDVLSGKLTVDTHTVSKYLDRITYDQLTATILKAMDGQGGLQ